ncbi:glycosyltransferase family 4 protein [Clostridium guangxiense]|uniref:glycosyltransferase family 4 protein n=1 Tax=Clostridium guangxiense TaxID=1662055 RepID=UPI001E510562|nr:glycosyltransferase family 4 protein [Clostridium guangxiense]MCD2346257.1 glycosyltransferase family 4 protein [Clostridium guangxiense]
MSEKKNLISICLVLPNAFPVPAVCGGAIETLMTSLAKLNNIYGLMDLTICCRYNSKAEALVKKMNCKYTHFMWTYPEKIRNKIKYFIFRVLRKLFKIELNGLKLHYGEISKFIHDKKNKFDLIIAEGGDYMALANICLDIYDPEQLAIHVHHHFLPSKEVSQGYGNIIGVSNFVTKQYLKNSSNKNVRSYVLKNSIDIGKFDKSISEKEKLELRKKLGFSKNDFIVLYVGRIIDVKGIKELIQSILNINDKAIKLLIIGSPNFSQDTKSEYLDEVNNLVNQNRNKIRFTGYIENKKIYMYESIANIQCVPSIWEEAAGLVVLEGMAAGLPTIVTNSGGMVEYVDNNTSIVVNKEQNLVRNLSQAIINLKNDKNKMEQMAIAAKENVKKYSEINYYNNFVAIVNDIVKRRDCNESWNFNIS